MTESELLRFIGVLFCISFFCFFMAWILNCYEHMTANTKIKLEKNLDCAFDNLNHNLTDVIRYKILDFNIFEKDSYPWQLINGDSHIPFTNIKLYVKNGDYVLKGTCIMTCEVDIHSDSYPMNCAGVREEFSSYKGKIVFNAPTDGFIYINQYLKNDFMVRKNLEICAICKTKKSYYACSKFNNTIQLDDYKNYILIAKNKGPYHYAHQPYNIFYLHPTLSVNTTIRKIINVLSEEHKDWWLTSRGGNKKNGWDNIFYINEDYTIDAIVDDIDFLIRHTPSLPSCLNFRKVSGNFKIFFYETDNDELITLRGCPSIVLGDFECSRNRMTKFENMPYYVGGDFIARSNKLSSFIGMPKYIGGCFNISNNEFDDASWEFARDNIEGEFNDYNIKKNKFVKYRKELY